MIGRLLEVGRGDAKARSEQPLVRAYRRRTG
jgi:hypothetical protein